MMRMLLLVLVLTAALAAGVDKHGHHPQGRGRNHRTPPPDTAPVVLVLSPTAKIWTLWRLSFRVTSMGLREGIRSKPRMIAYSGGFKAMAATITKSMETRLRARFIDVSKPLVQYIETDYETELCSESGVRTEPVYHFTTRDEDTVYEKRTADSPHAPWGWRRVQTNHPYFGSFVRRSPEWGENVTVYVLDSGIDCGHSEFSDCKEEVTFIGSEPVIRGTQVGVESHGTFVASIISGKVAGIAPSARVVGVRVTDMYGRGSQSGLIAALEWVRRMHRSGPAVVNMAVSSRYSRAVDDAVADAVAAGMHIVAAAGNNGVDACSYSPGAAPDAVTVASIGTEFDEEVRALRDRLSAGSNRGDCVDLLAPGEVIYGARGRPSPDAPSAFEIRSGTSTAAPHVAGTLAVYLTYHPDATPAAAKAWLLEQASLLQAGGISAGGQPRRGESPPRVVHLPVWPHGGLVTLGGASTKENCFGNHETVRVELQGVLEYPGAGKTYPHREERCWQLFCVSGSVKVAFRSLDLETDKDYVYVDGRPFTGQIRPRVAGGSSMLIRFSSDAVNAATGFSLLYSCS